MEVKRYIYQSPYQSPVQFGRPDPSTKNDQDAKLMEETNTTLQKAQQVKTSLEQQADIKVNQNSSGLDIYA